MNGFAWAIVGGYVALGAYILYQAIMLDRYRKWNDELQKELWMNQPPF